MLSLLPHHHLAELRTVACEAADLAARGEIAASRRCVELALARTEAVSPDDPWSAALAQQYRGLLATYGGSVAPEDGTALA